MAAPPGRLGRPPRQPAALPRRGLRRRLRADRPRAGAAAVHGRGARVADQGPSCGPSLARRSLADVALTLLRPAAADGGSSNARIRRRRQLGPDERRAFTRIVGGRRALDPPAASRGAALPGERLRPCCRSWRWSPHARPRGPSPSSLVLDEQRRRRGRTADCRRASRPRNHLVVNDDLGRIRSRCCSRLCPQLGASATTSRRGRYGYGKANRRHLLARWARSPCDGTLGP